MNWEMNTIFPVKLAYALINGVRISGEITAFRELEEYAEELRSRYGNTPIGQIRGIKAARDLFHAIGLDPTRRRPSSESLLRRALKNKGFHPVNILVDVANRCSMEFRLPICVYDAEKIAGNVSIRLGREGETYLGHNNRQVNLENRFTLADNRGPFGSPMTDSVRTAVDENTTVAVLVIFAPRDFPGEILREYMETFSDRVIDFCGGEVIETQIV